MKCPRFAAVCGACLLAMPFAAFAAKEAELLSSWDLVQFYQGNGTEVADNNVGGGGDSPVRLFDGNFENYQMLPRLGNGYYCVIDLASRADATDDGFMLAEIKVATTGQKRYSIYTSLDGEEWTAVNGAVQVTAAGTATYTVGGLAKKVKYVFDDGSSGDFSTKYIAEIAVYGYAYEPPQAEVISSYGITSWFNADGSAMDSNGGGGNGNPARVFDGNFENYQMFPRLNNGGYVVIDLSKNDGAPENGYYVTEVKVASTGQKRYSIYTSTDGVEWKAVAGAVQVTAAGTVSYTVGAVATQVKYVFDDGSIWDYSTEYLAEIQVLGMDPADIDCTHPSFTEWTSAAGSATCTEYGLMERFCTVCGERFTMKDESQAPLGHLYHSHLEAAGTIAAYGHGYVDCDRCDFRLDFADPIDLTTLGGLSAAGLVQFTDLSVTSTDHQEWGPNPAKIIDGSWDKWWISYWASAGMNNQHVDFAFGAPVDITSIEISVDNHDQVLQFYSVDDETEEETLLTEHQVWKDESEDALEYQRMTIPCYASATRHLRLRTADDAGINLGWGYGASMCVVEMHPYGTIAGANKAEPSVRIGLEGYETFAEAAAAAQDGDTITFVKDIAGAGAVLAANVTIDLNGNTWTISGSPLVANSVSVMLRNGTIESSLDDVLQSTGENGALTLGDHLSVDVHSSAVYAQSGSTCTIAGATISTDGPYVPVYGDGGSRIVMTSGSVYSANTSAIGVNPGSIEISGGSIVSDAPSPYAAVYIIGTASTMSLSGGTITAVHEAVQVTRGSAVIDGAALSGGNYAFISGFDENDATASVEVRGGAISGAFGINGSGTISVSGGTFTSEVPDRYCASGYVPKEQTDENGNVTYGVQSANIYWTGSSGALWSDASSWDLGSVPTEKQNVFFTNASDVVVLVGDSAKAASLSLGGAGVTLQKDAEAGGYGKIVLSGNISGVGTLTLNRTGVVGASDDQTMSVSCPLAFRSAVAPGVIDGSNESYFMTGEFVFDNTISGTGLLRFYSPATVNSPLTLPGNAYSCIRFASRSTINEAVELGDSAVIVLDSSTQTYGEGFWLSGSGTVIGNTVEPKGVLQECLQSDGWTGVCEFYKWNSTSGAAIDFNLYGNSASVVHVSGNSLFQRYIDVRANAATNVAPALVVDGTLDLSNGYDYSTVNWAKISGSGTLAFSFAPTHWIAENVAEFDSFEGSIEISATTRLSIGKVSVAEVPEPGACIIPISADEGGSVSGDLKLYAGGVECGSLEYRADAETPGLYQVVSNVLTTDSDPVALNATTAQAATNEAASIAVGYTGAQKSRGLEDVKYIMAQVVDNGDGTFSAVVGLNPAETAPEIDGESAKPVEVTDGFFIARVKTVRGLFYGLVKSATLDGDYVPAGSAVPGGGETIAISADRPSGEEGAFYKISVYIENPNGQN